MQLWLTGPLQNFATGSGFQGWTKNAEKTLESKYTLFTPNSEQIHPLQQSKLLQKNKQTWITDNKIDNGRLNSIN